MYSKYPFPISMENIPRQRRFFCLSLKFAAIVTALASILFSLLGLASCTALLGDMSSRLGADDAAGMVTYGEVIAYTINHAVTFFVSVVMMLGALREKASLIRPWVVWSSIQLVVFVILFIFYTTVNMANVLRVTPLFVYVIQFLVVLVRMYMLVLVSSFYKQLVEDSAEGERLKQLISKEMWYSA